MRLFGQENYNVLPSSITVHVCWSIPISDTSSLHVHVLCCTQWCKVSIKCVSLSLGKLSICFAVLIVIPRKVNTVEELSCCSGVSATPKSLHLFLVFTFLNQAHFLKIDPVQIVGMHVCVCVCPLPRLLISSGMIWSSYDWLNKFYSCYMAIVVGIVIYDNCSRYR